MGKIRTLLEMTLLVGFWCAVTTVTGCSAAEVAENCREAAQVIEVCDIPVPEFLQPENLPESIREWWGLPET